MAKPVESMVRLGEARLDLVPDLEACNPGLDPTEYNVVIAPAVAAQTIGRAGLILAPDDTRENEKLAMQVGRLVKASPVAFNYEKWPTGSKPPKAGDIVWYARYAGFPFEGADGKEYRIIKDKDIGAVIPEPKAKAKLLAAE